MNRSDLDGIEARARAAVATLSPAAIANARWSGLGGHEPVAIEVIEVFGFDDGGILAILAATTVEGDREALHLTLPLTDAPPWLGLHGLVADGGSVIGARGGRLAGRPGIHAGTGNLADGSGGPGRALRESPGDQSHTSVIVGEQSILKLYRRLTPGANPEAEVLEALADVTDAPVPAWR
ncbi:MAG: Maltokinase, partial [Chloroflexi bacterium]|nr:Maltokinase [Chloroflexota bacterium]